MYLDTLKMALELVKKASRTLSRLNSITTSKLDEDTAKETWKEKVTKITDELKAFSAEVMLSARSGSFELRFLQATLFSKDILLRN